MVSGIVLGLVSIACVAQADDPALLVERLGSNRFADREAAGVALEQLGRTAIPVLRRNIQHRDPEVRSRVGSILRKIENRSLLEPTLVAIEGLGQPLDRLVRQIGRAGGPQIDLPPGRDFSKVFIPGGRDPGPVPFWTLVDRICRAERLHYLPPGELQGQRTDRAFHLLPGDGEIGGPISDYGPVRVQLTRIHRSEHVWFEPITGQPDLVNGRVPSRGDAQFLNGSLRIVTEPHVQFTVTGDPILTEATDDQGRSLVESHGEGDKPGRFNRPRIGPSGSSYYVFPMRRVDPPGQSIRRLKGTLPMVLVGRKADPIQIPLAGAEGRAFPNSEVVITIHQARLDPVPGSFVIEMSVAPVVPGSVVLETLNEAGMGRWQASQNPPEIEIGDREGNRLGWMVASSQRDGDEVRLRMQLFQVQPGGHFPARLDFYGVTRTGVAVPFEFTDVRLP